MARPFRIVVVALGTALSGGAPLAGCAEVLGADFERTAADAPDAPGAGMPGAEHSDDGVVAADDGGAGDGAVACTKARADCNQSRADGCEVDLTADPDHCGGCGKRCAAPAQATATCSSGVCRYTCVAGFDACASGCCAHDAGPPCTLRTFYEDLDGDGYGSSVTTRECSLPAGFVGISGDCDDGNPIVHPNATVSDSQPYTVTGTARTSYDYDCDGKEEASQPMGICSTASSGWGSGIVCGSASVGAKCTYARLSDGGTGFCGTTYYRCETPASAYEWVPRGTIACH